MRETEKQNELEVQEPCNSKKDGEAPGESTAAVASEEQADDDKNELEEEGEMNATTVKKKKKKSKRATAVVREVVDEINVNKVVLQEKPVESAAQDVEVSKQDKHRKKQQEALHPTTAHLANESDEEQGGEGHAEGTEEEECEDTAPAKKKKKKKPKKKVGSGGQAPALKIIPDDEFADWANRALESTANGTEKMSKQELLRPPQNFWGYTYTGCLRPAYVSPQMKMPEGCLMPDYALDPDGISHSERKGPREVPVLEGSALETMREACHLGREVLDIAARFMRAGVTGDAIDRVVWQACVDRKIYPSPLNYYRFPKSVCVSPNEVICHGIPDSRPIEEGDVVNLDVSIYYQGFHSDLNETYFIGSCDDDTHRLVRTAYCALLAASRLIRPGTFYRDLGNAIHAEAARSNCAVVTTYCGHGVGQLFHGPPKVPHYRKNKAVGVMKPGHVFTVEPMINLGSNGGDRTWPDNWTAVTKDGKRSAQFEHTFLVTEQGLEVLTGRQGTDRTSMPPYEPSMFQL
mmetsp:Transcript_9896/g.23325  ORF Transcript_9896/g.23325 Transcript_9896/m.23325 type:complete len:519 (+) Transcript_9896:116-1672(+)|eukprot:CAMPEP_0171094102 /NCGR_PEP_ID=MMETSP0766_2-20121228/39916_1 /TAXON_ID=439317 /ORGANISM="Gambierdiscus australes, Strain CAWD 149" /LENGTH=518 /DNA_ID=CAMNT_0011552663 /DNA_START=107 /DNA_END=1663 /DNA_ORIENTATION=+